jgi:hypothetical protein
MLPVCDSIDFALRIHERGWKVQDKIIKRAREIKSEYINKKLGL